MYLLLLCQTVFSGSSSVPFPLLSSHLPLRLLHPWAAFPAKCEKASLMFVWGNRSQRWDEDRTGKVTPVVSCHQCTEDGGKKYKNLELMFHYQKCYNNSFKISVKKCHVLEEKTLFLNRAINHYSYHTLRFFLIKNKDIDKLDFFPCLTGTTFFPLCFYLYILTLTNDGTRCLKRCLSEILKLKVN